MAKPSSAGNQGGAVEEAPVASPQDVEFIRETAKEGLRLASSFCSGKVFDQMIAIGEEFEPHATRFSKQVEISEGEIKLVSEAVGACAVKYPGITRFAPEGTLICWFVSYGARFAAVMKEIKGLRAQVTLLRVKTPPAAGAAPVEVPGAD